MSYLHKNYRSSFSAGEDRGRKLLISWEQSSKTQLVFSQSQECSAASAMMDWTKKKCKHLPILTKKKKTCFLGNTILHNMCLCICYQWRHYKHLNCFWTLRPPWPTHSVPLNSLTHLFCNLIKNISLACLSYCILQVEMVNPQAAQG